MSNKRRTNGNIIYSQKEQFKLMKIAIIRCGGSLNVGNEFINSGGEYLIKKIFPEAECYKFECFDSCIGLNYEYPSEPLLKNDIDFINQNCDFAFILSGSIISPLIKTGLDKLAQLRCKKVLLGAGAYQYNDSEKEMALYLAPKYDYIFTRDDVSYSFFEGAKNVYSGIDLAFFAKDIIDNTNLKGNYAVINIGLIKDNLENIKQYKEQLKLSQKYENIYVVENTATKYSDIEDYLYLGYGDSLFKLFSKSAFVVTTWIHTSLVCLCYQIPFKFVGYDYGGVTGRNTLFSKVQFKLEYLKEYSKSELLTYECIIEDEKNNYINLMREVLTGENYDK